MSAKTNRKNIKIRTQSRHRLRPLASHMIRKGLLAGSLIAGQLLLAPSVYAGPEGGVVVSGQGSVTKVTDLDTTILQDSQNLLMNFDSFNLTADETVLITQPNAAALFVGQIIGGSPTAIFGSITANGRVALVNPRGIIFGKTATINAAGIFASALGISGEDIAGGGNVNFEASSGNGGYVINHGVINASVGGAVSLLGETVTNTGIIIATLGQVNLASGSRAVVNFGADQLIGIEITEEVLENNLGLKAAVSNTGAINATGGTVMLTSSVSKSLFDHAVNNEGVIKARGAEYKDGVIRLFGSGSSVINTGVLDTSSDQGNGGEITIRSDDAVFLPAGSRIGAGSSAGVGGLVAVDANGILLEGSIDVSGAEGGGDVRLSAHESVIVESSGAILADAIENGSGGHVLLSANQVDLKGSISVKGGIQSGDGGTVTLEANKSLSFSGTIDASAPQGKVGSVNLNAPNIEISDSARAGIVSTEALQSSNANIEINATDSVVVSDLDSNLLDLGSNSLNVNVDGSAISAGLADAITFVMAGADDTISTSGQITINVSDSSLDASALIDIAGTLEVKPFPKPLPNDPLSPVNTISLAANNGRIRIRESGQLLSLSNGDASRNGNIWLQATGFVEGNEAGTVLFSGVADVSSDTGVGGTIKILGDRVGLLDDSVLNASGALGGGEILVGGNYLGKGEELNAIFTYVGESVVIKADANDSGDGGRVIVWADVTTKIHGNISVTAGMLSGDGGFVETSGKINLVVSGAAVDASSEQGSAGEWLLDPLNVNIVDSENGALSLGIFTAVTADVGITPLVIETALESGTSVTINTGTDGVEAGTITVTDDISVTLGTATLTLNAADDIILVSGTGFINASGSAVLSIVLNANTGVAGANNDGDLVAGSIDINAAIDTNGGSFLSTGVNFDNTGGLITTGAGTLTITQTGTANINAALTTTNSTITIAAATVTVASLGNVDAGTAIIDIDSSTNAIDIQSGAILNADTIQITAQTNLIIAGSLIENTSTIGTFNLDFGQSNAGSQADLSAATLTYAANTVRTIDGGTGADTLVGSSAGETFVITGANQGTISGGNVKL